MLDDKKLVSGSWNGSMTLWDRESERELLRFEGHDGWVQCIVQLDERRIASCGRGDKLIKVWDFATGAELLRLEGHEESIWGLATLDARRIASASFDKTLRVWDLDTGEALACLAGHEGAVYHIAGSTHSISSRLLPITRYGSGTSRERSRCGGLPGTTARSTRLALSTRVRSSRSRTTGARYRACCHSNL